MEISCPLCKKEYEVDFWIDGDCECGNMYFWTDEYDPETGEEWQEVHWEKYKN